MNLVHLHPGPDTGGQSIASKRFLEERGDSVRVFVHSRHPFGYGEAEMWDRDAVTEAYRWADVVVVHNDPGILDTIPDRPDRTVVVHHHGTRFRTAPEAVWREGVERRVDVQVVSTIDLLLSVPKGQTAHWLPQVVDTARMETIAEALRPPAGSRIVVTHAPTNRMVKGTRWVTQTMRELRGKCDYVLIQHKPWVVCLTYKAASHIFIDQLLLGYGNNAIEAWAMGLPVISGAEPRILARMKREFDLPFANATPDTLTDVLWSLVQSAELREQWAAKGKAHLERFHVPDAWAQRTRAIYQGSREAAAA